MWNLDTFNYKYIQRVSWNPLSIYLYIYIYTYISVWFQYIYIYILAYDIRDTSERPWSKAVGRSGYRPDAEVICQKSDQAKVKETDG